MENRFLIINLDVNNFEYGYLKDIGLIGYHNYFFCRQQGYSRTRELDSEELLEQLPALQQLLYRLIGCRVRILNSLDR